MRLRGLIFFLFLSLLAPGLFAQEGNLLSTPYTPKKKNQTIGYYLEDIRSQTGIEISYSASIVPADKKVRLKGNEATIKEVLETILANQQVRIVASSDKILLVPMENSTSSTPSGTFTINGFIKDRESKEILIGAYVIAPGLQQGTVTNAYGFYSLSLPAGSHHLLVTYIGYKADTLTISLLEDKRMDVLLSAQNPLEEVKIIDKEKIESLGDHVHLTLDDINKNQALLGEQDVMRALQHIPGVQTGIDGTSGVQVRGGDPGQNLNLLDGSPLYFIDHFFGVTSVYNTEAVKSVDFHKGAFPARFGGRLSSIIDVHTRDGDMERMGGQFTMGLVKSSLNLEGPIIKNKASVMLSGRRTWVDGLWRPFENRIGVDFYDVNLKANYILNKNNRFYASIYNGRDQIRVNMDVTDMRVRWSNFLTSLRWNSIVHPKLFLNTTLTYSNYQFNLKDRRQEFGPDTIVTIGDYNGISGIKDIALRTQAHWYPSPAHSIQAGVSFSHTDFVPTAVEYSYLQALQGANTETEKVQANEVTIFLEDEIKLSNKWLLRAGLHVANWFSEDYHYTNLQPRIYTSYRVAEQHTVYASFSRMAQFLHLISNNTFGLPTDFWVPSTKRITPEQSLLGTVGYAGTLGKDFSYNIEGYYKDIDGASVYTSGRDLFDNSDQWQHKLAQGRGWSYGAEVSLQKPFGKFFSSAAYTLAWNWRQFDQLNNGRKFPHRYDRRHNLKLALLYKHSKTIDVGANWTFMSGEAITLPDQVYPDLDNNLGINGGGSSFFGSEFTYNYADWNSYRLPVVHRLDIGANFRKYRRKHYVRTWSVGMFNAYGRPNVMFVDLARDDEGAFKLAGISFLRFIPYITYKMSF